MTTNEFARKLTAILSADVKGYSRLMSEDEAATVRTLTEYREVMAGLIRQHRGRLVDSPGDNILAEFSSVVDALRCAWDFQQEIKTRNAALPENRKMNFRIGVNLGDVIEEDQRLYGDGVNIAARLEALAEEGGICISGTVYDHIKTKLPFRYDYQGEQTVKNIAEPVRVYRVIMAPEAGEQTKVKDRTKPKARWRAAQLALALLLAAIGAFLVWKFYWRSSPAAVENSADEITIAAALPGKPSIAVLPFTNLSGDVEQEYFSDGITNDIITDLSKFGNLLVIASNTVFTYKGRPVNVKSVGRDLGVRYLLEGSVQKAKDSVRINVQLIDPATGHHLWAERYHRPLEEIFALQDEIIQTIVRALSVKIDATERARVIRVNAAKLKAYDYVLKGRHHYYRYTRSDNIMARKLFNQAIDLDSQYASAYAALAQTHTAAVLYGWTEFPDTALEQAVDLAQKALSIDSSNAVAHVVLGSVYKREMKIDLAFREYQKALELNPNDVESIKNLGSTFLHIGRTDDAIRLFETARRFDPVYSPGDFMNMGLAYYLKGRYEEAIRTLELGAIQKPDFAGNHIGLAAAYAQSGRSEKARRAAEIVKKLYPFFELNSYGSVFRIPEDRNKLIAGLRKAGLE
ncbi:MAG: tetratricopeptide repeat protein [Desulfobacterales bacterium]|nr:MAG: tetratricopeptide repeat protein [Desulfobacterales bacterium]